jgi:phospholipid N-methyltransferase
MLRDAMLFIKELIRQPSQIGAIASSSRFLADVITDQIGLPQADVILEYGPGSGAFTQTIHNRIPADATYLAVEQSEEMSRVFRQRFPGTPLFNGSVADLPDGPLGEHDIAPGDVDAIISGLPWAAFDESLQRMLMRTTRAIMAPDGSFTTFAYVHGTWLPAGRRFRELLDDSFEQVTRSRVVWRNVPPAFCYRCHHPRPVDSD